MFDRGDALRLLRAAHGAGVLAHARLGAGRLFGRRPGAPAVAEGFNGLRLGCFALGAGIGPGARFGAGRGLGDGAAVPGVLFTAEGHAADGADAPVFVGIRAPARIGVAVGGDDFRLLLAAVQAGMLAQARLGTGGLLGHRPVAPQVLGDGQHFFARGAAFGAGIYFQACIVGRGHDGRLAAVPGVRGFV